MLPLFNAHPSLQKVLPHITLATLPTPVRVLSSLQNMFPDVSLSLKDDGYTAGTYGGNKVRKLEFLLGEALQKGSTSTLTFGFAGSNHALATAVHAQACGMQPISLLMHQPNATYVQKNLLYSLAVGTTIYECPTFKAMRPKTAWYALRTKITSGKFPAIIPPGGSSPLGNMGYVNAAYELKEQIDAGEIPAPDIIYLPLGTMGTVAGLALGLKAVGIHAKIRAVCVVDPSYANQAVCERIFNATKNLIAHTISSFAPYQLTNADIEVDTTHFGLGYAEFTLPGMEAIALLQQTEQINLEGSYTGKAMAALLADARKGTLTGKKVLFWKTCNSIGFANQIKELAYNRLPESFHRYFTTSVQPLDANFRQ